MVMTAYADKYVTWIFLHTEHMRHIKNTLTWHEIFSDISIINIGSWTDNGRSLSMFNIYRATPTDSNFR